MDVLYDSPCNPGQSGNTTNGPGYTGYSPGTTFTYGPSSICIDKRNNYMYIGFNAKSILPGGLPDFEPAVMAMNNDGTLLWWTRLYHEVTPAGDTTNSTPDQYIDAIAIDYSQPVNTGQLVVSARCHGNNTENLWEGNNIAANANAYGFQNRFTGTNGNIHISWLGKLKTVDATLLNSTYVAEYSNNTSFGTPHPDPNLDNWPDPNTGWPNVNTTYLAKNMLKVTANGSVLVLGKGRRTITTANAFQKMVQQSNGGESCWNDFIRQYTPNLDKPLYSTLIVGQWDTITQTGGDNVRLNGMFKTSTGIIAVGKHTGVPNEMPVSAVPSWGTNTFNNESAVVAYVKAPNIANPNDSPTLLTTGLNEQSTTPSFHFFPNPTDGAFTILSENYEGNLEITINNLLGQNIYTQTVMATKEINLNFNTIPSGIYIIKLISEKGIKSGKLIVK